MGKFVAYKKDDDAQDNELDMSSHIKYYRVILSRAFGETNFEPSKVETDSNIGTIDLEGAGLAGETDVRKRIAEEEGKYFFKWCDVADTEVKSDGGSVLNRLERMNVLLYWDTKRTKHTGRGFFDPDVEKELQNQDSSIKKLPNEPLKFDNSVEGKLKVSVQQNAIALYQDTVEHTQVYKYKLVGQTYQAVQTWIPKEARGVDDSTAQNYYPDDDKLRIRYLQWEFGLAECGKRKVRRCGNMAIPDVRLFCEKAPKYREWQKAQTTETWKRINDAAEDAAKQIPGGYDCYYYESGGNIDGFLARVDLGTEGSGASSGGYKGRADKVTEVDYLWEIVPASDTPEFLLAKVLSYLIGLDSDKHVSEKKQAGTDYHRTNYPYQREDTSAAAAANFPLLFRYFKKFLTDKERRNEPKQTPKNPRLYPTSPKNADKSLRKWKKGATLDGEALGAGKKETRLNAGGVMAKALRGFTFYGTAETNSQGVIKMSTLPATAFAKYVLTTDTNVQTQWKTDNGLPLDSTLDASTVRTQQEWCHLYGHGDGGEETLDNFVSGSEHCNTEQLAIETGQRRVSQNRDIDEEIRKRLTWRITAEEFPNLGSARRELDQTAVKKFLNALGKDTVKAYFFNEDTKKILTLKTDAEVRNGLQQLAADISEAKKRYRDPLVVDKGTAQKEVESLVTFQRNFLEQCYTYYPLGRYVRYRIFFGGEKCFEHLFDAQSESFDVNEAKILDYTVEYAIYLAMEKAKVTLKLKAETASPKDVPKDVSSLEYYKEIIKRRVISLAWNSKEKEIAEKLIEKLDPIVLIEEQPADEEKNIKKREREKEVLQVLVRYQEVFKSKDVSKKFKTMAGDVTQGINKGGLDATQVIGELKRERSFTINIEKFESYPKKQKS